jgi:hypothetical protein
MEQQIIEKPFDSKIEVGAGERGEDVVTLPPAGIQLALLKPLVFPLLWLGSWVRSFITILQLYRGTIVLLPNVLFQMIFLSIWLVGGGYLVLVAVGSMAVAMFGHEQITFTADAVLYSRSAFGFNKIEHFFLQDVRQFDWKGDVPYYGTNGLLSTAGCTMWYNRRRIPLGHGVSDLEGEWLASELNRLLKSRKR